MTAVDWQVVCINKRERNNPYERIEKIGVINHENSKQIFNIDEIIALIEKKLVRLFVMEGRDKVFVLVKISPQGNKFLQTERDNSEKNNLLSLPEC